MMERQGQLSLMEPGRPPASGKAAELAARIRRGNQLLWERWGLIKGMPDGEKRERLLVGWDRGVERLRRLCDELASLDGRCACEGERPTNPCLACSVPNERWSRDICPADTLEI